MAEVIGLLGRMCCSKHEPLETVTTRPGSAAAIPDVKVSLTPPGPSVASALTGPDSGALDLRSKLQRPLSLLDLSWCTQFTRDSCSSDPISNGSSDRILGPEFPEVQQQQRQHQQQLVDTSQPLQQQHQRQQPALQLRQQHDQQQLQRQQQGTQQQHAQPPLQQQHHHLTRQQQPPIAQASCGKAISLYDTNPLTGIRNGDPIADQYGVMTYDDGGAVLALADGVNWGQRPMWAAKAAVYGFLSHVHQELASKHGNRSISSTDAFQVLQAAIQSAQHHVTEADGTLTTLVASVVCQQRRGKRYCVLSVTVGDSSAFVWRAATGEVEDLTYAAPPHGFHRDPRVCPGCLGYATGDAPDLSNITYSIAFVDKGDIVFLTSDGISDNFDPIIRKQVSPRTIGEGSNRLPGIAALSPATCHAMAMAEMTAVLRDACRQQQQQPPTQQGRSVRDAQRAEEPSGVDVSLQDGGKPGLQPQIQTALPSAAAAAPLEPLNGHCLTAEAVMNSLLAFARQATEQQRQLLEDPATRQTLTDVQIADLVADLPGKVDHACVVAFKVGEQK